MSRILRLLTYDGLIATIISVLSLVNALGINPTFYSDPLLMVIGIISSFYLIIRLTILFYDFKKK